MGVFAGVAIVTTVTLGAAAFAGTSFVAVHKNGEGHWKQRITSAGGTVSFVTGPATAPIGSGSVRLMTGSGHGDDAVELRNDSYQDKTLSKLTGLSYWTYMHTNNGQQFPYLILNIDRDGNGTIDDLLFFEPPYQSPGTGGSCATQARTQMDTWQGWNARGGCWYGIDANTFDPTFAAPGIGTQSLDAYITQNPMARIRNASAGGGLRVLVGFASPTDNFDGNVDSFRVAFGTDAKTYDFDPAG